MLFWNGSACLFVRVLSLISYGVDNTYFEVLTLGRMFGPSFRCCHHFIRVFWVLFHRVDLVDSCRWQRRVFIILQMLYLIFFVRDLQGFILGWRLWLQVVTNDRCSVEAGETVLAGTYGGGLGTQTDPNEAVYLTPVNVSFCVQPYGETQARIPHSIEMLMPRSCVILDPARIKFIWLTYGVLSNHFSAVFRSLYIL